MGGWRVSTQWTTRSRRESTATSRASWSVDLSGRLRAVPRRAARGAAQRGRRPRRPHIQVDEQTEYGYRWWLRGLAGAASSYMAGAGGSHVRVFPDLDAVDVVT